jgi:hypothetical protein
MSLVCITLGSKASYLSAQAPDNSLIEYGISKDQRIIFVATDDDHQTFYADQICLIETPDGIFAGALQLSKDHLKIGGCSPDYPCVRWPRNQVRIIGKFDRACKAADCDYASEQLCWEPPSRIFDHVIQL